MEYTIDAEGKILGRLASEVALLLRGKNDPRYTPSRMSGNKVTVFNTDKMKVSGKKPLQKFYRRHSGYHGGLKEVRMSDLMTRDSRRVLHHAVSGMLPKNRSRKAVLSYLTLLKGGK